MKSLKFNRLSIAVGAALSLNALVANAVPAPTVTVEYGGYEYTLTSAYVSYDADPSIFTSLPWWGDASLAESLSGLVGFDLGDYNGSYPANTPSLGVLFGYGTSSEYVSIAYWENGTVVNCPLGCPYTSDGYAYAFGSRTLLAALTLADVQASLLSTGAGLDVSLYSASLLVNGAHSRPMLRRVAVGANTFWVAGDLGRDDHDSHNGSIGIAEFGVGHNYGPVQLNFSLGRTWADQKLVNDGDIDTDGTYLMLEGIIPVVEDSGIYATLSTYHHWADSSIHRGYMNMGNLEYSDANPDSKTWGLRARVDWEDAFSAKDTSFSPYVDLSHSSSTLDGYTETGGSFPASFDERKDDVTELRVGLNSYSPINGSGLNFVTNIEAAHRFDDEGARTSGEVVGLFAFDLDGEKYDSNWFKGGLGVEGSVDKGKLSVMLNGTTKGSAPSTWLAASYQRAF